MDEFKRRFGVVIQPPHQSGIDRVGHPDRVEVRKHGIEMLLGTVRQVIQHQRRAGGQLPHLGPLVIKHPQWVECRARPGGLVEVKAEQELLQHLSVLRSAGVVTQRGDLQAEPVESQRAEPGVGDGDHLGV